ncbi:MAG: SURF1 family protein [Actinomycetia bacterium]|nr:SURF1 family protein [Actinomycetes bacterium]
MATFDTATLRKPRWILAVVFGLFLGAVFVWLGLWQLSRLAERQDYNASVAERIDGEPRSLAALVGQFGTDPDDLVDRNAVVTGRYIGADEFFSVGRNYDGLTGTLVMTPLELDDGSIMIVVRGLVPVGTPGPPAAGYETPDGTVTLTGLIDDGEEPLRLGEPAPDDGVLSQISRVDLDYIDTWYDGEVLSIDLVLENQIPPNPGKSLIPVPRSELTEGRHLGYAVQWFAFAVIAVVGITALVWRAGTERTTDEASREPVTLE